MADLIICENQDLVNIANQIRGLRGVIDAISLDAMTTHLEAERTSITNALAAIADKGVTVPDKSTSDALAELITAIEAGGGEKVSHGQITFSSATGSHSWEHGLGVAPSYAIIFLAPGYSVGKTYSIALKFFCAKSDGSIDYDNYNTNASTYNIDKNSTVGSIVATDTTITVSEMYGNGNLYKFVAGKPYFWICATGVAV